MLGSIYAKVLRDRGLGLLISVVSVAAVSLMGIWVYSGIAEAAGELFSKMPEAFLSVLGISVDGTATALVVSEMANFIAPMVLGGLAIAIGADAVAGEERWGTMNVLLANPRSRTRLVLEKAAALLTVVVLGVAGIWAGYALSLRAVGETSAGMNLGATSVHLGALVLLLGAVSFAVGAWTGQASKASAAGVSVMLVSFFASGLLPMFSWGETAAQLFPWHYLDAAQPILNGVHWGHVALLVGVALALLAVALVGVRRRDLLTGEARTTLLDRMKSHPRVAPLAEKLAGQAQVKSILTKAVSDGRSVTTIAAAAMFYMGALLGPMFKGVAGEVGSLADGFPESLMAMVGFVDYGVPAGWYQGEIFSIMAPVAVGLVGINMGAKALAGEERDRTMGLLLASPVTRTSVVLEKTGAIAVMSAVVGLATLAGVAAGNAIGGLGISYWNIAAACLHLTVFGFFVGVVAVLAGALSGVARVATAAGTGVLAVSYAVASFMPINPDLAEWARMSPFYYYATHEPLINGMHWGHLSVLLALAAACIGASAWAFNRRDLRG